MEKTGLGQVAQNLCNFVIKAPTTPGPILITHYHSSTSPKKGNIILRKCKTRLKKCDGYLMEEGMRKGRCCPVMKIRIKCTDIQDNFPASTSKRKEVGGRDSMFSTGLFHDFLWLFVFVLVLLNSVH